MTLTAPFRLPPDFLPAFGYRAGRRLVALYWEPCGDEACYHDGLSYACGSADNWLFLGFIRRADVRRWLAENRIHLGNSEEPARHWLILDALTGEVHAAPWREALVIVRRQQVTEAESDRETDGGRNGA